MIGGMKRYLVYKDDVSVYLVDLKSMGLYKVMHNQQVLSYAFNQSYGSMIKVDSASVVAK